MKETAKRLIYILRREYHGGNTIRMGKQRLDHVVDVLDKLVRENERLSEAVDAANRECAALKAENERLNRENLWLTGGITK